MNDELEDLSGRVVHEVGIVESLAVSAADVAERDDPETVRRLRDLVVQIGMMARDALASARELESIVKGERHQ
jgi:hypothetical protein